ncbi:SEMA5 [Lepeophtheirus salmonis]|uniref:SEMA5 n=1 Tax=Lepeophtheirus salmonis TaxID=72036 RepID=A0A7R8H1C2_LEPSM|nr:SEMA5 [Lepeophtheirus salmonis]CAF2791611.1 SEMA5 [Lepeophtheirus salmonis]
MMKAWILLIFAVKGLFSLKEWPNCLDFAIVGENDLLERGWVYSSEACATECLSRNSCKLWTYKNYTCNLFHGRNNSEIKKNGNSRDLGHLYGFRDCSPGTDEHWPECSVQGFDLNWYCAMRNGSSCRFWNWDGKDNLCVHKSTFGPPTKSSTKESAYGSNKCYGKTLEDSHESYPSIHGGWSPWSKDETPCFNKRFGDLIKCGGGFQYRRRSCTNPTTRYGGRVCSGKHLEAFPCNTHHCQVPKPWLWSEWSRPKNPCGQDILRRESLCGALRYKLQSKEELYSSPNMGYWPTCLFQYENHGVELQSSSMASLKECFNACFQASLKDCLYWSYDFKLKKCGFYSNLKLDQSTRSMSFLTGNRNCMHDEIPPPFCGVIDKVYDESLLTLEETFLEEFNQCFELCIKNKKCHLWLIKISHQDIRIVNCIIYGNNITQGSPIITKDLEDPSNYTTWTGKRDDCISEVKPRIPFPELYEEMALIEPCQKSERKEMTKEVNFWNKSSCPSPCKEAHTLCPKNSDCLDKSTEERPFYECVCQLGLIMRNGVCRVDSINNSPKIRDSKFESLITHYKVIVVGRVLLILVLVVSCTLGFIYSKQLKNAGLYHRTIEIALVLANAVTLMNIFRSTKDICRVLSILAHFLWTGVFSFLTLEAIHIYGLICNIVLQYGIFSKVTNFVLGWSLSGGIVITSICFEYEDYFGDLTCWMNYGSSLIYAQILPNLLIKDPQIALHKQGSYKRSKMDVHYSHPSNTSDIYEFLIRVSWGIYSGFLVLSRDKVNIIFRGGWKRLLEIILRKPKD